MASRRYCVQGVLLLKRGGKEDYFMTRVKRCWGLGEGCELGEGFYLSLGGLVQNSKCRLGRPPNRYCNVPYANSFFINA